MTGPELRAIRLKLGLTLAQFGRALGYSGKCDITICHMELPEDNKSKKTITRQAQRLAEALEMLGQRRLPKKWL